MNGSDHDVDIVSLASLQLPNGLSCRDIWGQQKVQPALVSVDVELREGFRSAATLDALDASTIHYGNLAKAIRQSCEKALQESEVFDRVMDAILQVAHKSASSFVARSASVTLILPKASVHGETLKAVSEYAFEHDGTYALRKRIISFEKMHCMALIGVNAQERTNRQALLVTCVLGEMRPSAHILDAKTSSVDFERHLVTLVESTQYETLEALANHLSSELHIWLVDRKIPIASIRLALAKPHAVLFADAPIITTHRTYA